MEVAFLEHEQQVSQLSVFVGLTCPPECLYWVEIAYLLGILDSLVAGIGLYRTLDVHVT